MIKIRKLGPAELAKRIENKKIEQEIKLIRDKPFYLPHFNSVLLLDEYVGTRIPDDIAEDFGLPLEIVDSIVENHLDSCEICLVGEPCSNLASILSI